MNNYIYEGPVWINGFKKSDYIYLETKANSLGKAKSNFIHQISILFNVDIKSDIVIRKEEIEEKVQHSEKSICPKCGSYLNTSGLCPYCDEYMEDR